MNTAVQFSFPCRPRLGGGARDCDIGGSYVLPKRTNRSAGVRASRAFTAWVGLLFFDGYLACHLACHLPAAAPSRPTCAGGVCATVDEYQGPVMLLIDVEAPAGARLKNAVLRVATASGAPCQSGVPVAEVGIDGRLVLEGPAAIAGKHHLRLRFNKDPREAAGVLPSMMVDLDFEVGGRSGCLSVVAVERTGQ